MQSSIASWLLKKPAAMKPNEQAPAVPPRPPKPAALKRPPPPPKSVSAPSRVPSASALAPQTMDNWNDIPDDFLQAPSRPRSKKSPRSSRAVTPASGSRVATPVALALAPRPLPPNVELSPLTEELLPAFRRLVALTLPIAYPESFFKESMSEPYRSITLLALWHSTPNQNGTAGAMVGAIRCRLLPSSQLYISTIGVLAPYRTHGIAMHLLQAVVKKAVELHSVRSVVAHVWEANEEGLDWYEKRNFEILDKEAGYYKKLNPQGAILVRKCIGVGDLLSNTSANAVSTGQPTI